MIIIIHFYFAKNCYLFIISNDLLLKFSSSQSNLRLLKLFQKILKVIIEPVKIARARMAQDCEYSKMAYNKPQKLEELNSRCLHG